MAKTKAGLPEGFDIGVTSADLAGPAALPGYLDDDPVLEFAKMQKEQSARKEEKALPKPPPTAPAIPLTQPMEAQKAVAPAPRIEKSPVTPAPVPAPVSANVQPSQKVRRRLQINLDPEGERMVEELLDLVSDQSSESRIKISEFVQGLVLNLYNARSQISLGSLPVRGRWGSPTAKSFPAALAQAFREAIVAHDQQIGGNQFKKASGG